MSSSDKKDVISQKWDRCTAQLIVNTGIGLVSGIGLSVVLFRRRFFPIPLAVGFAAGMSYEECRRSFSVEGNMAGKILRRVQPVSSRPAVEPAAQPVVEVDKKHE